MQTIYGVCGLTCSDCDAYQATKANDAARFESIAAKWRADYNNPAIEAASVWCNGCLSLRDRRCGHTDECRIRACGLEHGIANCAKCPEYGCEKIENFLSYVPGLRSTLEALRGSM